MVVFLLGLVVSLATANESTLAVFKGAHPKFTSGLNGAVPVQLDFGLSTEQQNKIRELTEGRIDFSNVYTLTVPTHHLGLYSQQDGYVGFISAQVPPPLIADFTPDPKLNGQWWIEKLKVPAAWQMATGAGVTIADCDAGFYHDEPDLHANMELDYRYDLSDAEDPLTVNDGPYAYHGTAVSAIMAGVMDFQGTNGIAFESRIVPLQNFNYDSKDDKNKEEATAACILRAIDTPDVKVIVLENQTSNGSSETFVGTRDAVRLAMQAGITVVGAAGNYSVELTEEKTDDTGSIIVGALASNDSAASFTNYGERITVGAYGENLFTLYGPDGYFGYFGGTSGATPQVAATVAMILSVNPMLSPEQIRDLLKQTRVVSPGNEMAGGLLDVEASVRAALTMAPDYPEWLKAQGFRARLMQIL
ncbi:MAG: S8 family serine peptidase [Bdellovibrionales bacterium]